MPHLYEVSQDFLKLQEELENAENVDEGLMQALTDTMEGAQGEFEQKAVAIVNLTKNITSSTDAIDAEIKRLQQRKKTITDKSEWLKGYLRDNMERTGINKIECEYFTITLGKPTEIVEITDELQVPDDLVDIETKIKPKKTEIKKLLKAGEDVPGAELKQGKWRLMIR